MTSYYVYAIQPADVTLPADVSGFHAEGLTSVRWRELAAIAAPHDDQQTTASPERVTQHHQVVCGLREIGPAIPVRFGTVFADCSALKRALEQRYEILLADIQRLGGKVEYGITVLWGSFLDSQSLAQDEDPADVDPSTGTGYMRRRLREYQRESRLRRLAEEIATDVDGYISRCSEEHSLSTLPAPAIPVRGRFLVRETETGEFEREFELLRKDMNTLRFLLVGPWPPYSFVSEDPELNPGTHAANSP